MQIFLSHSSRQKPLVREIRKHLPDHLGSWLDEERLLFGDRITGTIESTIREETDYVLLFVDEHAIASSWVQKELDWTLRTEVERDRTILLPVVIDADVTPQLATLKLHDRKYLSLKDFSELSVRALSEGISSELFALVCRDVHRLRHPQRSKTSLDVLADAEALLRAQAAAIQKAVFPHREQNPISREKLREVVATYDPALTGSQDFNAVLDAVVQRNMVPGLSYDGYEAYVIEEHASWKSELQRQKKEKVARKAAIGIKNGVKLFLDAGSTTEEIVRILCRRIETRALTKLTVATTSVNIADMLSDCCVKMGFDDDFSAVRLFIPGGQIRPCTQAIVPLERGQNTRQILELAEHVGGFDMALVGVNGVHADGGFTTHDPSEAGSKAAILAAASTRAIVGDSTKIGLQLECKFAGFEDELTLVVDDDPESEPLQALLERHCAKILLA